MLERRKHHIISVLSRMTHIAQFLITHPSNWAPLWLPLKENWLKKERKKKENFKLNSLWSLSEGQRRIKEENFDLERWFEGSRMICSVLSPTKLELKANLKSFFFVLSWINQFSAKKIFFLRVKCFRPLIKLKNIICRSKYSILIIIDRVLWPYSSVWG